MKTSFESSSAYSGEKYYSNVYRTEIKRRSTEGEIMNLHFQHSFWGAEYTLLYITPVLDLNKFHCENKIREQSTLETFGNYMIA